MLGKWAEDNDCPHGEHVIDEEAAACVNCGMAAYRAPTGLPEYMSPSQMNALLTCGEQYRLERLERVPQRPMWASVGGTVVHKLTEKLDREWYARQHPEIVGAGVGTGSQ